NWTDPYNGVQYELGKNERSFDFPLGGRSGKTYSLQACAGGGLLQKSNCTPWAPFAVPSVAASAPADACTNQGLVSVGGSAGCYGPGSRVISGTGLPRATDIKQCVTAQAYNAAHPCGSGGLVAIGGSDGCYCPGQMVNSGTGLPRATDIKQCV